jgi:FkbM family methyltransferase
MPSHIYNFSKKTALSLLYKLPPFPQQFHGKWVWVHPRARFSVSTGTFFKGESHVRRWITEQLKPGQVFFDVGAHHGWVSMWALSLLGEQGSVFSFEPSPANLSILEWHKAVNRYSHWRIIPKAVSDADAAQHPFFLIDSGDSPMNSLTNGVPGTSLMEGRDIEKISVHTVTLDKICSEFCVRPNLIKIDVEGAELLVLRGAGKLLRESTPTIILAVHPFWLPPGQSPLQIVEFMKDHGYAIFDSNGDPVTTLRSGEYLCQNISSQRMS